MIVTKSLKVLLFVLLDLSTAVGQGVAHRHSEPLVQKTAPPPVSPSEPTINPIGSLAGIQGLSINLDNMYFSKEGVEGSLSARLQDLGVKVLPKGTYPMLEIYTIGASGSFNVGYVAHSVHGVTMILRIKQLLPLGSGFISAQTYSRAAMGVGVYGNDSQKARAEVVNGFFDELASIRKPVTPDAPVLASGDLTNQLIEGFAARIGMPKSLTTEEKARWQAQVQALLSKGYPRALTCNYKDSNNNWLFWYKSVPAEVPGLLKEWPQGPFNELGDKALEACPKNLELAKQLTQRNRL